MKTLKEFRESVSLDKIQNPPYTQGMSENWASPEDMAHWGTKREYDKALRRGQAEAAAEVFKQAIIKHIPKGTLGYWERAQKTIDHAAHAGNPTLIRIAKQHKVDPDEVLDALGML